MNKGDAGSCDSEASPSFDNVENEEKLNQRNHALDPMITPVPA